jgi:hypothetical protein
MHSWFLHFFLFILNYYSEITVSFEKMLALSSRASKLALQKRNAESRVVTKSCIMRAQALSALKACRKKVSARLETI